METEQSLETGASASAPTEFWPPILAIPLALGGNLIVSDYIIFIFKNKLGASSLDDAITMIGPLWPILLVLCVSLSISGPITIFQTFRMIPITHTGRHHKVLKLVRNLGTGTAAIGTALGMCIALKLPNSAEARIEAGIAYTAVFIGVSLYCIAIFIITISEDIRK